MSPACAAVSGVAIPTPDLQAVFAAVNDGCGQFVEVMVTVAPGALVCDAMTAVNGYTCAIQKGVARAFNRLMDGLPTGVLDMPITLTGPVDCTKPATIAITRTDLTVEELVAPVQGCRAG